MSLLFDGATPWDATRLAAVKAHGGVAVSVYIVGSPGGMRCANAADVALARSLGLGVIPNWERASDFFRTASIADCKAAGVEALAACRALGIPDDGSIAVAFSFDYQVPATGYPTALDQLRACGDGMGGHYQPIGYAQSGLIEYWSAHGLSGPHWLMASTWGQPYNISGNVALVQSHTAAGAWLNSPVAGTDINTVTQPARLLAWWPDGSPYGDDVELSDTIINPNTGKPTTVEAVLQAMCRVQKDTQGSAAVLADALQRVADLQAQVATLAAQVAAQPTVQPADIPVTISGTGTAHIGSTS